MYKRGGGGGEGENTRKWMMTYLQEQGNSGQKQNKTNNKLKLGLKIYFSLSHDHNNFKPTSLLQLEINTNIHDPKCYPPPGNQKTGSASHIRY